MIPASRFIANKAIDNEGWLEARTRGVTATQVANASTPAGFKEAVEEIRNGAPTGSNAYMDFGLAMEGPLSLWLKDRFEIMPNEWLIAAADNYWHLATPDGLSLDHKRISEIKTTGKPWSGDRVPIRYQRQIQWQLHVTGAEHCVLAWMLRVDSGERFVPGWIEPETTIVLPDLAMQKELSVVADRLREEREKQWRLG